MKDNKDYSKKDLIKVNKNKMLFIGFIIGIIPFLIIMTILSIEEGGIKYLPEIFRNTIIISGLITSLINAITFKNMYINKVR